MASKKAMEFEKTDRLSRNLSKNDETDNKTEDFKGLIKGFEERGLDKANIKIYSFLNAMENNNIFKNKKKMQDFMVDVLASKKEFEIVFDILKEEKVIIYRRKKPQGYYLTKLALEFKHFLDENLKKSETAEFKGVKFILNEKLDNSMKLEKGNSKMISPELEGPISPVIRLKPEVPFELETVNKLDLKNKLNAEKKTDVGGKPEKSIIQKEKIIQLGENQDYGNAKSPHQTKKSSDEVNTDSSGINKRESMCLNCRFLFGACPRHLDPDEMEKIYVCTYFQIQKSEDQTGNGKKFTYDKDNMDVLELFSRDLDLQEEEVRYGDLGGTIGTDNYEMEPEMSPCLMCKYMFGGCPQDIDSEKMELMRKCAFYEPLEMPEAKIEKTSKTKKPKGKKKKEENVLFKNEIKPEKSPTPLQSVQKDSLTTKKQDLLKDILSKWEQQKDELRVVCSACESDMVKRKTRKKEYYICSNFPECKVQGDPWYINKAIKSKNGLAVNKIKSDLIVMYKFDKVKNVINISSIYSEEKLFL